MALLIRLRLFLILSQTLIISIFIKFKTMYYYCQGITLSTGTDLLSQFPNLFKFYVIPTRPELYSVNPSSSNIRGFQLWVEDEE